MRAHVIPVVAGFLLLAACDVSQKKPVTGAPSVGTAVLQGQTILVGPTGATAAVAPSHAGAADEKSIRLTGRGVSRTLQTRI